MSQRLSLWGHCLFLAVLSRITGNLNLIFVLRGKFTYLERVGTPLLRCLHPKGLRVLNEVGHSFGVFCFVLGGFPPDSSTLAWKIPWAEELGGLQSMGSHRVGHD